MQTQTAAKPRGGRRKNVRRQDGEIRGAGGKLLNLNALATELGVTKNWIHRKLYQAEPIPHIKLPQSQRVWFDFDAVVAWFRSHSVKPAPTVTNSAEAGSAVPQTKRQPRPIRRRRARR